MIFNRNLGAKTKTTDTSSVRQRLARERLRLAGTESEKKDSDLVTDRINGFEPTEGDPVKDPILAGDDIISGDGLPEMQYPPDEIGDTDYGEDLEPTESRPPKESDEDYLDKLYKKYIEDLEKRGTEGRDALAGQLDEAANEALMTQEAKAGAAGLGLSGAAQSLQAGTTAQLARQRALGLDEYDQNRRQEMLQGISKYGDYLTDKQEAALSNADREIYRDFLEREADEDLDGDNDVAGKPVGGTIGDGDTENNDTGQFGDETNSKPVDPENIQDLPAWFDASAIDTGHFRSGDDYMGSDDHFDYYFSIDDHKYYKVRRA